MKPWLTKPRIAELSATTASSSRMPKSLSFTNRMFSAISGRSQMLRMPERRPCNQLSEVITASTTAMVSERLNPPTLKSASTSSWLISPPSPRRPGRALLTARMISCWYSGLLPITMPATENPAQSRAATEKNIM